MMEEPIYTEESVDREGWIMFLHQMVHDALRSETPTMTSANRVAKSEAIAFFQSTQPDIVKWREYIMDVALGYDDHDTKRKIILELIKQDTPWMEVKKFAGVR